MYCLAKFDGMKKMISSKGNPYGDIFVHGITADGEEDIEQSKFRTFSAEVISKCETLKNGDSIFLDLTFKDASINSITVYEE